jgi:hypothetical protein
LRLNPAELGGGSITAASWGVFLSLLLGLIAAAIGGIMGYSVFEKSH